MKIDVRTTPAISVYHALVSIVTPRPIAWVTSISATTGVVNLAPYSFYNVFGVDPPVVVFSPGLRRDGSKKDTLRNIEETGEFVVNTATEELASHVNLSAKEVGPEHSEVDLTGLTTRPSEVVKPPRLAESPVALECRLLQIVPIGGANLVIGEVVLIHVDDAVTDGSFKVSSQKLRAIGRLGGDEYCRSTDVFEIQRPI